MKTAKQIAIEAIREGGAISKKQLAAAYGISSASLRIKLRAIPGFPIDCRRQILFPDELSMVFEQYGNPAASR